MGKTIKDKRDYVPSSKKRTIKELDKKVNKYKRFDYEE